MFNRTSLAIILSVSVLFVGCDDITNSNVEEQTITTENTLEKNPGNNPTNNPVSAEETILEIAASNDNFSILAQAVTFADLDEALDGRRQLTVFAPTNEAFVQLLDELGLTAEELFVEENKELVTNILLYHVAPGKRQAKAVVSSERINTLLGKFSNIKKENGNVLIGNEENGFATIIDTNIFASNGVVHVIDGVLLPPSSN